jgi:hypothetical protein
VNAGAAVPRSTNASASARGAAGKGLRVSRYLSAPGHVRFSVWGIGRVEGAVSIDESEARRLASFLRRTDPEFTRTRLAGRLRQRADALLETLR